MITHLIFDLDNTLYSTQSFTAEEEADSFSIDFELRNFLASIPLPKAVLTNSMQKYADEVIDRLGIRDQFEHIFDISYSNFKGKPHPDAFLIPLKIMGARPENTLFIDDFPGHVAGFLKIGGNALLLDEFDRYTETAYQRIKHLKEIKNYLT